MSLAEFKTAIRDCHHALLAAKGIELQKEVVSSVTDFKKQQQEASRKNVWNSIERLATIARTLDVEHVVAEKISLTIKELKEKPSTAFLETLLDITESINEPASESIAFNAKKVPEDIRQELLADVAELQKCFSSACYRSSVILCGRILETALHRKYYEVTNNDLLEKAPGIGLGNVIAKMAEHGIELDPGLANQIHLINQVRVWSVHKKQTPFNPSKAQAHAIMLYTFDVIEKLWK